MSTNRLSLLPNHHPKDGELVRNNNRRIDRYAFFYDVYKHNCWWWEIYERYVHRALLRLPPLQPRHGHH